MRPRFSALALLPTAVLAGFAPRSATVYLQPSPPSRTGAVPQLSPYEANSVLANYVGLSRSIFAEAIEDAVDFGKKEWNYLWHSVHPVENTIGAGNPDVVMLFIQSDTPQDFVPLQATFTIPDAPEPSHFTELLDTYVSKAHTVFDKVVASILDFVTPSEPASLPTYKGLLDVFDLNPSESTMNFMDELHALISTVESKSSAHDDEKFTALQMNGLAQIAAEHGRGSEVYQTAAQTVKAVLSNAGLKQQKLALIVHPSADTWLASRADGDSDVPPPKRHGVIPIFSSSQCFTTSDACSNSTNSCSGHGGCVEVSRAAKTCWACSCGVTKDSKGRKTTWAGRSCERKDYSVQFVLLAGSAIFLIAIVLGSVKILYTIGDVALPNTLTSGSTSHLKKE